VQTTELSPKAKELLNKFGHYYQRPFAGSDFSSASSGVGLASLVVAAVNAYKGFWWGVVIGVVFYMAASLLARQFNPENFLVDKEEERAHEEILLYIKSKSSKRDNDKNN